MYNIGRRLLPFIFFFQAEDGIRDLYVTGVQTCALPIFIQAGKMTVAIDHVPIRTNPKTRESRLFPSMWAYVRRNTVSIFRIYALYEPLRVFMTAAIVVGLASLVIWLRFGIDFIVHGHSGHIQSLILGAVLFIAAVQLAALGVVGDILAGNRVLNQRILERVRRVELRLGIEPSHYEPGASQRGHQATTGAGAGPATGKPEEEPTEEREAVQL